VIHGSLRERVGRATETASALSVVVKDPTVIHADTFGSGGALIARLSVRHCGLADLSDDRVRAAPWKWSHDPVASAPFLRLVERAMNGSRSFPADDGDVADLVALVTRRPARPAGEPPRWLSTAIERVHEGWRPSVSVSEIAADASVHPVYFARCVRRWYGTSAADLIRRVRLRHAAESLAAGAGTVSAAAHDAGYADEPHLCRSFADAAGLTPGRFRRLVRLAARLDSRLVGTSEV
jgi:AraC family transcriptional regulator